MAAGRPKTKRSNAVVDLARTLKSRGYAVSLKRAAGRRSTVTGTKKGKAGGMVQVAASGRGRKLDTGSWAPTIHRNSGAGGKRGWSRVIGGKGPRTAAQRAASIRNLAKGRSGRVSRRKR